MRLSRLEVLWSRAGQNRDADVIELADLPLQLRPCSHFDHDLPYSRGGTSVNIDNVQLLCARHNISKGAKVL
jgi:hypothetical protein